MEKVLCPQCNEPVLAQPRGSVGLDNDWEYEFSDCPICGHIFTATELKRKFEPA